MVVSQLTHLRTLSVAWKVSKKLLVFFARMCVKRFGLSYLFLFQIISGFGGKSSKNSREKILRSMPRKFDAIACHAKCRIK